MGIRSRKSQICITSISKCSKSFFLTFDSSSLRCRATKDRHIFSASDHCHCSPGLWQTGFLVSFQGLPPAGLSDSHSSALTSSSIHSINKLIELINQPFWLVHFIDLVNLFSWFLKTNKIPNPTHLTHESTHAHTPGVHMHQDSRAHSKHPVSQEKNGDPPCWLPPPAPQTLHCLLCHNPS